MEYKIIFINNNDISYDNLKKTYLKLNNQDKNRVLKINKSKKISFLTGRYLLSKENIDISKIYYNSNNKPLIKGLYFSISHSFNYTILVISNKNIGIDMEKIRKIDNKTIKYILKNKYDINKKNLNILCLKEFTKKEAYIKLKGLSLKNIDDNLKNYTFKTFEHNNFIITICTKL